jgi:hypothetical protein
MLFQYRYNQRAEPFRWNYTREQLEQYLARVAVHEREEAERLALLQARRAADPPSRYCLMN